MILYNPHPPSSPWSCKRTFASLTDLQPAGRASSKYYSNINQILSNINQISSRPCVFQLWLGLNTEPASLTGRRRGSPSPWAPPRCTLCSSSPMCGSKKYLVFFSQLGQAVKLHRFPSSQLQPDLELQPPVHSALFTSLPSSVTMWFSSEDVTLPSLPPSAWHASLAACQCTRVWETWKHQPSRLAIRDEQPGGGFYISQLLKLVQKYLWQYQRCEKIYFRATLRSQSAVEAFLQGTHPALL